MSQMQKLCNATFAAARRARASPLAREAALGRGRRRCAASRRRSLRSGEAPPPNAAVAWARALSWIALGGTDDPSSVAFRPSSVAFLAFEAFVHHVVCLRLRRGTYAWQPGIGPVAQGEEGLSHRLILGARGAEAEKPVMAPMGSAATSRRKPSNHPRRLDQPMSA